VPVKASGRTLRTKHSGLRAESVARVKCSTSQGRPTGSAENIGGPQQDNRSGENQAGAAVSLSSTSDGEWHRDVKVGRGGERSQVGESPPVLLGEASSRQPKGRGPAPPLGNERMFGLKITEGPSNGSLAHATLARAALANHDLEAAATEAASTVRLASTVRSSRSADAVADLRHWLNPHQDSRPVADFFDLANSLLPA
jgi:hypothetical protein